MRAIFLILSLWSFLFSQDLKFPLWDISYGGITIQCDRGCGDYYEDPNFSEIIYTFAKCIDQTLNDLFAVLDEELLVTLTDPPWGKYRNYDDWDYERWDWQKDRFWPAIGGDCQLLRPLTYSKVSVITYPDFLDAAQIFREDLEFYYLKSPQSIIEKLGKLLSKLNDAKEEGYRVVNVRGENEIYFDQSFSCDDKIRDKIRSVGWDIESAQRHLDENQQIYQEKSLIAEKAIQKIDHLFKDIFLYCLENHQIEGKTFKTALELLVGGDYHSALGQVEFLIKFAHQKNMKQELLSKLHFLEGQLHSEFGLYSQAIVSLTEAICRNPNEKEAYLERAAAYFELGEYDQAIDDYILSGYESLNPKHKLVWSQIPFFSAGITKGILEGAQESAIDFVPSALSTLRGMGKGLWAFSSDPVGASVAFCDACNQCIQCIRDLTTSELLQEMVLELKELIQDYDMLTDFNKGSLIGHIIGRYGIDILFCNYSVKAIKAFQELKRANKLLTIEALASPANVERSLQKASQKFWEQRKRFIHEGKQGKHQIWHENFEAAKNRSIFEHEYPQLLIDKYAGTGVRARGVSKEFGSPGYQEIVNFEEHIGFVIEEQTGKKTATTWGKIHYAKDGVHIVPCDPVSLGLKK